MEDLQQMYFIGLMVGAAITVVYILLSDLLEPVFGFLDGILNPVLILSFLTFFCASGYLLEFLPISSFVIILISMGISLLLVTLLNVFVLIPLSNAEATLGYTEEDLRGRMAKVIISIPEDGFGEIMITDHSGHISRTAKSFEETSIASGEEVIVIDIKDGVLYVAIQEKDLLDS
ncbi:NfeD family protein [Alkalihalobacillus pseudalcaliphilus]|uniref:NfeD family protein n=1 Tax=Alkalihalobacillus pseudalcaliphilus TaxID=79884 RepID=UPI00064DB267|nr:NfeD family protein [Alkalihalobacillus pseudalcaliphilus]KMK76093.1 membrane protein [Alkalihalobacillus pseudalcaliphilus]